MTDAIAEQWVKIPFLDGRYLASNFGRIKGPSGRVLALKSHVHGYLLFGVADGSGRSRNVSVARSVCAAFHGVPRNGEQVDHIDRCRTNDTPSNLRWVTKATNLAHRQNRRGERHPHSKLTEQDVRSIRAAQGRREDIAAVYSISPRHVTDIKNHACWGHVQ